MSELTGNLESLSLAHNTITSLGANAFGRFTNLDLLNLSGNPITSLHSDAFDGLYGLKSLSLGGYNPPSSLGGPRQLTLSANQFADNVSLQGLSLSNSGITAIPNNTFNNLNNLERLYLNDNDLTTLTRDMFHADLGSVQLLELGCNNLTTDSFDSDWLNDLDNLQELYLHHNDLETVDYSVFRSYQVPKLRVVSLDHNPNLATFQTNAVSGYSHRLDIFMFGNPLMKSKFAFGLPSDWPDNIHADLHSNPNRCEPYDVQQPTFRAMDASARESNNGSDSSMTFTVILQYSGGETHTVEYHTQDGTATAGSDYTATSGTLTFGPGDGSKEVSVTVRDDNVEDNDETFQLVLSNPSGNAQLHLTASTATGTILNHDEEGVEASFPVSVYASTRHTGPTDSPQVVVAFSEAVAAFGTDTPSVQVTGGTVASVQAHEREGLENARLFFITPDGDEDVTFALVANATCASGGICTGDGTPLTTVPSAWTIPGPDSADTNDADDSADDDGNQETETPDETPSDTTSTDTPPANTPATGQPTISGTAQVDETLTAEMSGISDEDGLTGVAFNYQWIRSDNGSQSNISGATGSTYTPVAADVGKAIKVRVSFTDEAGHAESLVSQATATVAAAPPPPEPDETESEEAQDPLTASTHGVPGSHDGENVFTFELRFSEELKSGFSFKTLKFHAFTVTGGEITRSKRLGQSGNLRWTIHVQPDGNGDVTLVLPATADCDAEHAICTEDGRPLSNRLELTVDGPDG